MQGAGVVYQHEHEHEHERESVSINLTDAPVRWAHNSSLVNRCRARASDREEDHFGLPSKSIPQEISGPDECVVGGEITPPEFVLRNTESGETYYHQISTYSIK